MSAQQDADQTGQRRGVRRINNSVMLAIQTMQKYKSRRISMGLTDAEFQQTAEHSAIVKGQDGLHNITTTAFELLRYYLQDSLAEEYWFNDDIEFDDVEWPDGMEWPDDDNATPECGMHALRFLPEPITYSVTQSMGRQGLERQRQKHVHIPFSSYQKIIRNLDNARGDAGFAPAANKSVTRTEISDELIEDYNEWAEKVLRDTTGDPDFEFENTGDDA